MPVWTRLLIAVVGVLASRSSAQNAPAFVYESVLDTYCDAENGLLSFREYDLAFAPEGPLDAKVVVTNDQNTIVASFAFRPEYRFRSGVFARAAVEGPADVTLTDPGVYNIIFLVSGEPVTRLPVVLEETSAGDDPFDPAKTYRYFGLWQTYAHLTTKDAAQGQRRQLTLWIGGRDLPEGAAKDLFAVTLKRDGEVVAVSKKDHGHIPTGHYRRQTIDLFLPHDERQSQNAGLFAAEEWARDGSYELTVTRRSDGQVIRTFAYEAKDGTIAPLPDTQLGFEPAIDYIVPRVVEKNVTEYGFVEVVWLRGR